MVAPFFAVWLGVSLVTLGPGRGQAVAPAARAGAGNVRRRICEDANRDGHTRVQWVAVPTQPPEGPQSLSQTPNSREQR